MTEATPAIVWVFEALFHYDSTRSPACQAAASDFPVHFPPRFYFFSACLTRSMAASASASVRNKLPKTRILCS